jgi:L-alanine-DL-glutamate epimerase-like enolase superfamily enzyme
MKACTKIITLNKRFPFTISRETRTCSHNIFVSAQDGTHEGIGECDPGTLATSDELDANLAQLNTFIDNIGLEHISLHDLWTHAHAQGLPKRLHAALDIALWDLHAKRANMPLHTLLGLTKRSPPTSMTLGITPLELIPSRIDLLLGGRSFRYLKIKLGSQDGIEYDQEAFTIIKQAAAHYHVGLRVDANGGWSLNHAQLMCAWLAERDVEYVEQPLHQDQEDGLRFLFQNRPLPIFVDESCNVATDIVRVAPNVDGVNIKLMKCGGITEAVRMVAVARAFGLKTMIGCMSESSVAIAAGAALSSLFDFIDLDSCFNLNPDPACGVTLEDGVVTPSNAPGHGARLC